MCHTFYCSIKPTYINKYKKMTKQNKQNKTKIDQLWENLHFSLHQTTQQ